MERVYSYDPGACTGLQSFLSYHVEIYTETERHVASMASIPAVHYVGVADNTSFVLYHIKL